MRYFTLALIGICTLQAAEKNEHGLNVDLKNAQQYEITYKTFDNRECTTITLTNETFSDSITYQGRLEGESLVTPIESFDRSIKDKVEKLNEDNSFDLRAEQRIKQCCAFLVLLGFPVLNAIYSLTSFAL